jgi:hypothetical protein
LPGMSGRADVLSYRLIEPASARSS